jgi:hypothetical protein
MQDKAQIRAYMNAIAKGNFHAIEEAIRMSNAAKSLDDVFVRTGLAAKWKAEAKAEAEAQAEAQAEAREKSKVIAIARNMISSGFPLETVVSMTELEAEEVKKLLKKK